ncbi:MAG: hypothetical protein JWN86_1152 [Planctomycetota bacterium]|nr:hypothetical protein [Planctomycetota bacterium]
MADSLRRQIHIRALMIGIAAVTPFCVLARIDAYLGIMAAAYAAMFGILAVLGWDRGRAKGPLGLAVLLSAALIASWSLVRGVIQYSGLWLTRPSFRAIAEDVLSKPMKNFVRYGLLERLAAWESWSLLRWWILFAVLTWICSRRVVDNTERRRRWRAVLAFAPWLIVMELGYLGGVWFAMGHFRIVPEPNTIWADFGHFWHRLNPRVLGIWFLRCAIPTLIVGIAYTRTVLRWPWKTAIFSALALIPIAIYLSLVWSSLYLEFLNYHFVP